MCMVIINIQYDVYVHYKYFVISSLTGLFFERITSEGN